MMGLMSVSASKDVIGDPPTFKGLCDLGRSVIIGRANDWLADHAASVRLVHVEVLEVDGIYSTFASARNRRRDSAKDEPPTLSYLSAFLKLIRYLLILIGIPQVDTVLVDAYQYSSS